MLLAGYDSITWGGWESHVKYLPEEKQKHLMRYFDSSDLDKIKKNPLEEIRYFSEGAREVCSILGLAYPVEMEAAVTWKRLNSSTH
ncbi:hypothetical protein [Eisenbergiella sp.]